MADSIEETDVAVVGAGGDGAVLALALAKQGISTVLQELADQQVFYWNTANPAVAFLRDRVFQTLDRNARLRYQVLSTTAGLRTMSPFNLIDRVIAAGLPPTYVRMRNLHIRCLREEYGDD
jgi:cation diffusion facilitator CzcD-associated flavoprotein CzcO